MLFSVLIDNPGDRFSGLELAQCLRKPSCQSISGILSGAERVCTAYGRKYLWLPELQSTGLYVFSMDDVLVTLSAEVRG
ncbi:DUF6416 domain-containing protein [Nocardia sp. JCM 34519.1]|uniref:DUF6416 domain-containing protein n=1 Tax=unclassified Nocardia TaxID=2637762 RepID=UPI001CE4442B